MKILFYSVLSLFLAVLAWFCYDLMLFHRSFEDQPWYHEYGGAVRGFFAALGSVFAIWTYFMILRGYAAKRRKAMASNYGRTDCPVIAEFTEAFRLLERADYGMANLATPGAPPPLPATAPPPLPPELSTDQAADAIRAKLVSLQRMKEEGLITAEEYADKKGELLKQI